MSKISNTSYNIHGVTTIKGCHEYESEERDTWECVEEERERGNNEIIIPIF